jgi:AcrR family transcriptional regulator
MAEQLGDETRRTPKRTGRRTDGRERPQPATGGAAAAGGAVTARPLRSDARRNHDRLVAAAREVFSRDGTGAAMEAVAREAGVGVGTLYRHFPRRIDLLEAVYRNDVDELVLAAEKAVANLEPWAAVVAFLEAFLDYAERKRTFLNELREAFEKNPGLRSEIRRQIDGAANLVVERAQAAGAMRTDVSGAEVTQLVGPICTTATLSRDQSERLLRTILDGLRAGAPGLEPAARSAAGRRP